MTNKRLNSKTKQVVKMLAIFWFAVALSGIFTSIFIWKQTQNFTPVVVYNLFFFITLFLVYLLSGYWLRKCCARNLIKLGFIMIAFFYALIVILREKAILLLIPLGIIKGTGEGLFWSGFNLHQYVHTQKSDRHYYFGVCSFWTNLALVSGPLLGGLIISVSNNLLKSEFIGYYILFFFSAFVFILAFQQSFKLPKFSEIKFKISNIKEVILKKQNFRKVLKQQFLLGLKDVSLITISSIFAFVILSNEFHLGLYRSIIGLFAGILGFIAGRLLTSKNRLKISLLSAIVLAIGAIVFAVSQDFGTLILYGVCTVLGAFLDISLGTIYFSVIDQDKRPWQKKYAYFIARDSVLGLGRIGSYFLLWLSFNFLRQEIVIKAWLAIAGSLSLGIWFIMKKINI